MLGPIRQINLLFRRPSTSIIYKPISRPKQGLDEDYTMVNFLALQHSRAMTKGKHGKADGKNLKGDLDPNRMGIRCDVYLIASFPYSAQRPFMQG